MQTAYCYTWADFQDVVSKQEKSRTAQYGSTSTGACWLYRGQADASWGLDTTLERYWNKPVTVEDYYRTIHNAKAQIESYTGRKWHTQSPSEFSERMRSIGREHHPWSMHDQTYEYLVHLRHHGFPSPLLDWSMSPFVAAFFAFSQAKTSADKVAVFAFLDDPNRSEYLGLGRAAIIRSHDANVSSHRRHFLQQSRYTTCLEQVNEGPLTYGKHSSAFSVGEANGNILYKYTFDRSLRLEVLKDLNRYNVNAYSLFGSEESLMETAAMRAFYFS